MLNDRWGGRGGHGGHAAHRFPWGLIVAGAWILVLAVGTGLWLLGNTDDDTTTSSSSSRSSASPLSTDEESSAGSASPTASPSATSSPSASPSATPDSTETTDPAAAGVSACSAQLAGAEQVVAAARQGIDNLAKHVGAHQAWVEGRFTEEQKGAVYKATRLAGPGDVKRFAAARSSQADAGSNACAAVTGACSKRDAALKTSLQAGEAGMSVWEQHLTNMADFAAGKFDSERAQALWDETQAQVPALMGSWNKAEQALRRAPDCA